MKNVGVEAMNDLINERKENGDFKDFDNFISRVGSTVANKKTLEALACVGAFDDFNIERSSIFNQSSEIVKYLKSINDKNLSNQEDMFGSDSSINFKFLKNEKWSKSYSLMKEFEMLGFYLTGHPLDQYKDKYHDLNLMYFDEVKLNKNLHSSKGILMAGTLLSKKEKRSARGNAYAFLNFSDDTSIYELIIFETNLRKYREILVDGESYVLGIDFTSDNNTLRGELKKIFTFDEVIKFNRNNKNILNQKKHKSNSVLKIFVNEDFTKDRLTELKLASGHHKVEIIINNQTVKIPGYFEVSQEMLKSLKTMNGVVDISFTEEIH